MEQLTLERSRWIAASCERIWQAITTPEQMAQWLLPPALGAQMKRDATDTLSVCMGPMEIPVAVLEEIHEPRQVTIRSLPDRLLTTTLTLSEEKEGTRVTVTTRGFELFPEDAREDRLAPHDAAWEKALENLDAFVAGTELPFPEGYVAAMFGYRREAQQMFAVERSIWIDASCEAVWDAITDPALVEQWFSPGTPWALTALEVGGRLFVPSPETGAEMYAQRIEQLEAPYLFVTRSVSEPPAPSHVTAHRLKEEDGGTRLTITFSGYEQQPESQRSTNMERDAFGFGMMLENLKRSVEGGTLPYPSGF